ncbi:Lrp/AsnC ligand binding domain-containing protein [Pseudomonas sp. BIC9C]|uniref:Lrp/AsnC ligand binding domain-containing protein n=1 Tax=Pseudomonas sp. BIC9C TaxID=3078458 RepID=UPI003A521933
MDGPTDHYRGLHLPALPSFTTVAGDGAMLLKVRTQDTRSLEGLLEVIHSIDGFTGTRSYIVLTPHLERGPSPVLSE